LYTALGDVRTDLLDMTVTIVPLTSPYFSGAVLTSTLVTLSGKITDTYDFRADTWPAVVGAVLQAGFDGGSRKAGQVFKYELRFQGSSALADYHTITG
jgi:hypothetical protein